MQIIKLLKSSIADPFLDKYNHDLWNRVHGDAWRKVHNGTLHKLLPLVCHNFLAHIMNEVETYATRIGK